MSFLNAQTYVQVGSNLQNSKVKFIYDANTGGNRPSLSIRFPDGFDYFENVMPVCAGEYYWCLRNKNNEDIAYLKIDFNTNKSKISVKIKFDSIFEKEPNKEKIKNRIKLLEGTFVKYNSK